MQTLKNVKLQGAWLAQLEERGALDFRVTNASPTLGVLIT